MPRPTRLVRTAPKAQPCQAILHSGRSTGVSPPILLLPSNLLPENSSAYFHPTLRNFPISGDDRTFISLQITLAKHDMCAPANKAFSALSWRRSAAFHQRPVPVEQCAAASRYRAQSHQSSHIPQEVAGELRRSEWFMVS